jgi:hypothetical protein
MSSFMMALEVMCHPFLDGKVCVLGGATYGLRWTFLSLLFSFLFFCLEFHTSPFKNEMCHISLYFYQFWSSFFWFIFILLLMFFEIDFFFQFHLSIFFSFIFLSNLVLIFFNRYLVFLFYGWQFLFMIFSCLPVMV